MNKVFYRHIANWVAYSRIHDVFNEFFICDANCPDDYFLSDDLHVAATCNSITARNSKIVDVKKPATIRKFYINGKLLPSVFNGNVANLILVIGKLGWILTDALEKDESSEYNTVWKEKKLNCYKRIMNLQDESFSLHVLEIILKDFKSQLSESLRDYMFKEANLMDHFQLIRDYYGLGRGELFQQFIVDSEMYFNKSLNDSITSLNNTFMDTAISLYTEKDKTYSRFELVSSNDELKLSFDVKWPLYIFFHPKAMEIYNKLFSYLLRLKRTNINLQKLWLFHIKEKSL